MNNIMISSAKIVCEYPFIYIFLLLCFIFLILSFYSKKKNLRNIGMVFFSIFMVFCFFEIVLAFKMDPFRYDEPNKEILKNNNLSRTEYKVYIEDINGKKNRYGFRDESAKESFLSKRHCIKIYDVKYSMLDNFVRFTDGNSFSENAYIFLGCSFTFGDGLNDNQTLPYYFSKLMNFNENVLNLGIIGRSTNFTLNMLNCDYIEKYVGKAKNKHFIYSLILDHMMRNFNFMQYVRSDSWLYKNGVWERSWQPFGTIQLIFAKSCIFRKIFLPVIVKSNKNFYEDYMIMSLNNIRNLVETKYNAKFTIIVWPSVEIDFKTKLAIEKFDIIELPKYFEPQGEVSQYRIPYDEYPTAKANKEIAEILYEHLKSAYNSETKND